MDVFPPRLSRQKRCFSLVFLYVCISQRDAQKLHRCFIIHVFMESHVDRDDEFCMGLSRSVFSTLVFRATSVYRECCGCCQPQWILSFPFCVSVSLKRLSAYLSSTRNTTCRNYRVLFSLQSTQAGSLPQCSVTISTCSTHHFQPDSWLQM